MGQPYVGEIRMFAGNFAPAGWEFCDGRLLSVSESEDLFNLIGTTYGGDGLTNFAVPDLRGRVPIHFGAGPGFSPRSLAERGGTSSVTLLTTQMPAHAHTLVAATGGTRTTVPAGALPAAGEADLFSGAAADTQQQGLRAAGGGQPHENRQPVLAVNFIISRLGRFPSPT